AKARSRAARPGVNRPCCSTAGSKIGIITLSRLPHSRSNAAHSAVIASLIVAPHLRLRSRGALTCQAQPPRVAGVRACEGLTTLLDQRTQLRRAAYGTSILK